MIKGGVPPGGPPSGGSPLGGPPGGVPPGDPPGDPPRRGVPPDRFLAPAAGIKPTPTPESDSMGGPSALDGKYAINFSNYFI